MKKTIPLIIILILCYFNDGYSQVKPSTTAIIERPVLQAIDSLPNSFFFNPFTIKKHDDNLSKIKIGINDLYRQIDSLVLMLYITDNDSTIFYNKPPEIADTPKLPEKFNSRYEFILASKKLIELSKYKSVDTIAAHINEVEKIITYFNNKKSLDKIKPTLSALQRECIKPKVDIFYDLYNAYIDTQHR